MWCRATSSCWVGCRCISTRWVHSASLTATLLSSVPRRVCNIEIDVVDTISNWFLILRTGFGCEPEGCGVVQRGAVGHDGGGGLRSRRQLRRSGAVGSVGDHHAEDHAVHWLPGTGGGASGTERRQESHGGRCMAHGCCGLERLQPSRLPRQLPGDWAQVRRCLTR